MSVEGDERYWGREGERVERGVQAERGLERLAGAAGALRGGLRYCEASRGLCVLSRAVVPLHADRQQNKGRTGETSRASILRSVKASDTSSSRPHTQVADEA